MPRPPARRMACSHTRVPTSAQNAFVSFTTSTEAARSPLPRMPPASHSSARAARIDVAISPIDRWVAGWCDIGSGSL